MRAPASEPTPRPSLARKLFRYGSASVAGTVTNQVVLVLTYGVLGMAAVTSNLLAVTCGAVPNYLVNRAWTWNKRSRHSFTGEVLPFYGMSLLGLVLSTVAVAWADDRWPESTLAVSLASVGAFGSLWVVKFVVLDRVLFKHDPELLQTPE